MDDLTRDDAIRMLWEAGDVSWRLRKHQQALRDAWLAAPGDKFLEVMHRQGGKTYGYCVDAIEEAISSPGPPILYGTYSFKATRAIVRPTFAEILADAPAEMQPEWNGSEGEFRFPNGSCIVLAGFDAGRADNYRGRKARRIYVDEAGFIDDLEYVLTSVLYPMLKTTGGRIRIGTTPPRSPGHYAVKLAAELEAAGAFVRKTVFDDPAVTKADIERFITESGGTKTSAWRREYLAEFVVDEATAVIPEFHPKEKDIVRPVVAPPHYHPIVAMDVGGSDFTAVLFGFWDFLRAKLCVQDEIVIRLNAPGRTTAKLAELVKAKEAELWGKREVFGRWSDTDVIFLNDLATEHHLYFVPTAKDDKEAQVAEVRRLVQAEKLEIDPRCRQTIAQTKSATWNKRRTSFDRTETMGHFDAVDALIYLARNAPRFENPYPAIPDGVSIDTHWINPPKQDDDAAHALGHAILGDD